MEFKQPMKKESNKRSLIKGFMPNTSTQSVLLFDHAIPRQKKLFIKEFEYEISYFHSQ